MDLCVGIEAENRKPEWPRREDLSCQVQIGRRPLLAAIIFSLAPALWRSSCEKDSRHPVNNASAPGLILNVAHSSLGVKH